MPVIAVINQKGGSSKSTTAVHLVAWLHSQGAQCLLIDADGQRTSSIWLESLGQNIESKVIQDPDALLDALPKLTDEYQWIVIDGPANLSEATRAAILWADLAAVPCQPTGVDLASAGDTVRLIKQAQKIRGGLPQAALFLARAVKGTRLKGEASEVLGAIPDTTLLSTIIHQRQIVADAFGQGATVFSMTGSPAGIAAREYAELFKEMMELLKDA
ncbi:MAG: AAA family ATPase [Nodosilinea sp.]